MKWRQVNSVTIDDAVHGMANEAAALPEDTIRRELMSAIWLGKFDGSMTLQGEPIDRYYLQETALGFGEKLWKGDTLPTVTADEAGMSLEGWLLKRHPSLETDTIGRMIHGYRLSDAESEHHILLNGATTTTDEAVSEGDHVSVPACKPFITSLSFDELAGLPLSAYDGIFHHRGIIQGEQLMRPFAAAKLVRADAPQQI